MRKFETMLLLSPELSGDLREAKVATLTGIIEQEGGSIVVVDNWGMRDLAYPINKQNRGYYVRLEYMGGSPLVAELERKIRTTESEGIFRFLTVKLDEETEKKAQKAEEAANV